MNTLFCDIYVSCNPFQRSNFANTAFENKFLLVPAGNNVLRYFPPLNVTLEEIDKSIEKMEEILNIFEK